MAFMNILASVPEKQVNAIRRDASALLRPSLLVGVSHLLAYWVEVQPLGELLGKALDGGERVSEAFWHPRRDPVYHSGLEVRSLHKEIADEWAKVRTRPSQEELEGFRRDIETTLKLFAHASARQECVVSALDPAVDESLRARVRWPFVKDGEPTTEEPEPSETDEGIGWSSAIVLGTCVGGLTVFAGLAIAFWRYRRGGKPSD